MTADAPGKVTQAQRLTKSADAAEIFRGTDGETAFATIDVNDHQETWRVRSKGFRRWLTSQFYAVEDKPPGAQALTDALGAIEARAQFAGATYPVNVRIAGVDDGLIYFDLVNDRWEAVEITVNGWRVVGDPHVKFQRARGMLALPHPVAGGSIDELRGFVNVADDQDWTLLLAWLVAAVKPNGPYPVLVLGGEQGSAKSTVAEVLRRLI